MCSFMVWQSSDFNCISYVLVIIVLAFVIIGCTVNLLMNGRWRLFGMPFRVRDTERPATIGVLKARDLSFELKTVANWSLLGINLGVPIHELSRIAQAYRESERQKLQMLDLWLERSHAPSWREVVNALELMGEIRVAERIRQKYIRGTSFCSDEDSGTVGITRMSRQKIEVKFAALLTNICRKLRGKQINFTDLQMFFTSFFSSGEWIAKSSNIQETFDTLTRHKLWGYWNYYPLEGVVQAFVADDQEILSWIETYKEDLRSYRITTKVIDHIAAVGSDSSYESPSEEKQPVRYDQRYYQKLSIKLKMKVTDHTLDYIEDLWKEYAELHGLPPYKALLDCIHEGCVLIVWLLPTHLAPQILHAVPHSDDFYRKHEIMWIELGGKCIYQEKKELDEDPHFREPVETETAEELMKKVWVPKQDSTISLLREIQKGIATVVSHAGAARIRQNTISTELAKVPTLR